MINGGKSTALKGDMQGGEDFFADWQSAENEEARAFTDGFWGAVSELNSNDLLRCTDAMEQRKCRLAIGVLPMFLRCGLLNISNMYRVCIVYVTCM